MTEPVKVEPKKKSDPFYCHICSRVILFIPREEKLKFLGDVVKCDTCQNRWLINESRYMGLKVE